MICIYHVAGREGDPAPGAYRALVPAHVDPERMADPDMLMTGPGPWGELVPFAPPPARPDEVIGQRIRRFNPAGFGAGFFAMQLDRGWLVFSVWLALAWMEAEGRMLEDISFGESDLPQPWDLEAFETRVTGQAITGFHVAPHSLSLTLEDGLEIRIAEDPARRPRFKGTGGQMVFDADETLERAVFWMDFPEIWFDDPANPAAGVW